MRQEIYIKRSFYMVLICLLLLAYGCERPSTVSKSTDKNTAVYISGGTGLYFGLDPIKDSSLITEAGNKYRVVIFKIPESMEDIDSAVSAILVEDGYKRTVQKTDKNTAEISYRKGSDYPVIFRYKSTVEPGLKISTVLNMWWFTEKKI